MFSFKFRYTQSNAPIVYDDFSHLKREEEETKIIIFALLLTALYFYIFRM
jgi:hypothetical protein